MAGLFLPCSSVLRHGWLTVHPARAFPCPGLPGPRHPAPRLPPGAVAARAARCHSLKSRRRPHPSTFRVWACVPPVGPADSPELPSLSWPSRSHPPSLHVHSWLHRRAGYTRGEHTGNGVLGDLGASDYVIHTLVVPWELGAHRAAQARGGHPALSQLALPSGKIPPPEAGRVGGRGASLPDRGDRRSEKEPPGGRGSRCR